MGNIASSTDAMVFQQQGSIISFDLPPPAEESANTSPCPDNLTG